MVFFSFLVVSILFTQNKKQRPNVLFIISDDHTSQAWGFYDLKKDPQENYNAYQDAEYVEIIKTMKTELLIQRKMIGDMDKEYLIMKDILDKYWN